MKGVELLDEEVRSCWTVQSLGQWSLALMGAEWAGGRETAMLAGGSAGTTMVDGIRISVHVCCFLVYSIR